MYPVQYIAFAIFILMVVFTILNFRKSVLFWIPFHVLCNPMIALTFNPGIAVGIAVVSFQFGYYLLFVRNTRKSCSLNPEPFVLKDIVGLCVFSYLISIALASVPLSASIIPTLKYFILGFIPLFLFQKALDSSRDIYYFIKCCIVVTLLTFSLGAVESILHDNPYLDFLYLISPPDELEKGRMSYVPPFLFDYATNERFGLRRCYSFFGLHLLYGFASACLFFVFAFLYTKKMFSIKKVYLITIVGMCLGGVFFSNSKQAMLSVCVMFLAFYKVKDVLNIKVIAPVIAVIIAIVIYAPDYFLNFVSLVDSDVAEEGGGSSVALRQSQGSVMLELFMTNPITGIGPGGNVWHVFNNPSKYGGLMGSESVWLLVPSERGIIGVIAYLSIFKCFWSRLKNIIPRRILLFLLLSVFVAESAGGEKDMMIWGGVVIFIYRVYSLIGNEYLNKCGRHYE